MTETNEKILTEEAQIKAQEPDLNILYEDKHVIVVLKPQMTPCCPDESKDDNLFDQVKKYIKIHYNTKTMQYTEQ